MFTNLQINRTLVKKGVRMRFFNLNKTVTKTAMQEEWLEIQAAQRNPARFAPLYQRYYEGIFRFIYRRTAKEALSADLCSQVFLKAMQKLDTYEFKGVPFSAWLYRIANNEVAQHFRKEQKNRIVSIEASNLSELFDEMEEDNNEYLRNLLITTLDNLKPQDLELIEMRFFEQRAFKEIANILNITESNAKVKTYRILERMKKKMKEK